MKKYIKFLIITLLFLFNIYVEAEADFSPESQEQVNKQKQAIENYCDENKTIKGCVYDKNKDVYTKSASLNYKHSCSDCYDYDTIGPATFFFPKDIPLTRGYQTFDGNGNAVFAGCYRYVNTTDSPSLSKGTYFLFEIIYGNCSVKDSFVVPSKGSKQCSCNWGATGVDNYCGCSQDKTYSGTSQMLREFSVLERAAKLNEWVALDNGDCPKVFGYTANTRWYTSKENKYVFSDNENDFNIGTISFWGKETYVARPGCTVKDVDGQDRAQELLNEILTTINNKQCPSKIEEMSQYSENFVSYYKGLLNDNEYNVLWSSGLISETTKQTAEEQINAAIKAKTKSCQYKICNISNSQKTKIEKNLGDKCKNGCGLSNVRTQSDSANAKCYCCGNSSQGCTYEWREEGGSSCALQENVPKLQCIGTTTDLACRNCLNTAYTAAGLSDEQKVCMAGNDLARLITEQELLKASDAAADQAIQDQIEENKELREEIFESVLNGGKKPSISEFGFGMDSLTCKQILGPNLTKLVHVGIKAIQIIGAILAIVKGMMTLIPAVMAKDAEGLKKAQKTLVTMAIILLCIFLLPYFVRWIGNLLGYDISCLI